MATIGRATWAHTCRRALLLFTRSCRGIEPGFLLNVTHRVNGTAAAPHQSGTTVILVRLQRCTGDCDGETAVTVNELITMVNIALGNAALSACPVGDVNANSAIEINEIVIAVNNALNGCR